MAPPATPALPATPSHAPSMIVVDLVRYMEKIHHDHGKAKFGLADNRVTATFCRP
jgi:hypothetical protein